jgi:hypothetical protein
MNAIDAVTPCKTVSINGREYRLGFPFSVIIEAEKRTGLSLKTLGDWIDIPYEKLPAILDAGFRKYQPDIPEDFASSFLDAMTPEQVRELCVELWTMNFPLTIKQISERTAKGKTSPNG